MTIAATTFAATTAAAPPIVRSLPQLPCGQMHVRAAGDGPTVTLLHWTPASSRQYLRLLPLLAAAGHRALAPDHMGYGLSDPRPAAWLIEDYADSIVALWDALGVARSAVVGGHLSSEIATEIAVRHPGRVTRLVLDGCPIWSRETRDRVLAAARQPPPPWAEDGGHVAWAWQRALWLQRMWEPDFRLDDAGAARLRDALIDSLIAQQSDDSAEALRRYDMAARLPRIAVPTLVLGATTDPLFDCYDRALALVPGARGHAFQGGHPLHDPAKAAIYAGAILPFLNGDTP